MKTLKIIRIASLAVSLTFLLLSLISNFVGIEEGYDWKMIAVLAFFLVFLPVALFARIKNEENPEYVAKSEKGMIITNLILWPILIAVFLCLAYIGQDLSQRFIYTVWGYIFLSINQICNGIILYKAKLKHLAEEEENEHKNK